MRNRQWIAVFLAGLGLAVSGCGDFWYGSEDKTRASVTTPAGVQTGDVSIPYTLEGETGTSDVEVVFSTNGTTFSAATAAPGSEGIDDLTVTPEGAPHTFLWRSKADLANDREGSVLVRIRPDEGVSDTTGPIAVHNARFLAAVREQAAGEVRLHRLDAVGGALTFLEAEPTGGTDPREIVYHSGHYLVSHATTQNVAVLALDAQGGALAPVSGSPFATDGGGARFLATDGKRVFVSNETTGTITVFDWNAQTRALTRTAGSGRVAFGCRGLAVWNDRLYVASEPSGTIIVFDVAADGTLAPNPVSPISSGGLSSPRAIIAEGTRLHAANFASPSIAGFNLQGSGDATPIGGSPFAASRSGIEALARNGSKLFAVDGAGAALLAFTLDASGALTEDAGSPFALSGPSTGVASAGSVVAAVTTTSRRIEVFLIDAAGAVTPLAGGSVDAGVELRSVAVSD
jgi:6-phosphogluconolactonase (cycloisomerase 2 family)